MLPKISEKLANTSIPVVFNQKFNRWRFIFCSLGHLRELETRFVGMTTIIKSSLVNKTFQSYNIDIVAMNIIELDTDTHITSII